MTLLAEIQSVLERTYRPSGVRLEECLIGPARSRQLDERLRACDRLLSPKARTYLRCHEGSLHLALYFDPALIARLEDVNPSEIISQHNIHELIAFIEEITHGVHAALAFHAGWQAWESEQFACNLELQARVDTYWILLLLGRALRRGFLDVETRLWMKDRLFGDEQTRYESRDLERRYRWAREGARCFIELCEGGEPRQRQEWIREFRDLNLTGKLRFLRRHCGDSLVLLG